MVSITRLPQESVLEDNCTRKQIGIQPQKGRRKIYGNVPFNSFFCKPYHAAPMLQTWRPHPGIDGNRRI